MDDNFVGMIFKIIGAIFFLFCIIYVFIPKDKFSFLRFPFRKRSFEKYIKICEDIRILAKKGNWDAVLEKCNYGVVQFPEHSGGLLNFRGKAWREKMKQSISSYDEKEDIYLYFNNSLNDYTARIKEFNTAFDILERGLLLFIKGDLKGAIADFDEAKKLDAEYFDKYFNLKWHLDDVYSIRILLAVAWGMQDFFRKREEMHRAGYKYNFSINSRFEIDPIIIYIIPEFERNIIANIIEVHNNENIKISRKNDFDIFKLLMKKENIKNNYFDEYLELKIYDTLEMLEIIYGDIDKPNVDMLVENIKKDLW